MERQTKWHVLPIFILLVILNRVLNFYAVNGNSILQCQPAHMLKVKGILLGLETFLRELAIFYGYDTRYSLLRGTLRIGSIATRCPSIVTSCVSG